MARLEVFNPVTYELVADLSAALNTLSYQEAAYGSLDGEAQVMVTSGNRALLESMTECSHFVRVSPDSGSPAGAVIKDAHIDKGVCYISLSGFLEYLEIVPLIASQKAGQVGWGESITVPEEDPSWAKILYAESNLGLLSEIFDNLANTMVTQGREPFFMLVGIDELIEGSAIQDWGKSYRINTLETPNVAQVYSDLTEDTNFLPVRVMVTSEGRFKWILSGMTSYIEYVINEAVDDVKEVSIERGQRTNRFMALASGSDPKGNDMISRIGFNGDAAYSSAFADSSSKSTLDIARANRANIAGANLRLDQITFSTWNSEINIFSVVRIYGQKLDETLVVITQKSIEGQVVTYTGTIVSSVEELVPGVTKPTSEARRLIYEPAKLGDRRSLRQGLQKQNPTGWR